jgi:hypothetical protein
MGSVKLIGKDLNQFAAIGTFTGERRQILVGFKSGAMHWRTHGLTPSTDFDTNNNFLFSLNNRSQMRKGQQKRLCGETDIN